MKVFNLNMNIFICKTWLPTTYQRLTGRDGIRNKETFRDILMKIWGISMKCTSCVFIRIMNNHSTFSMSYWGCKTTNSVSVFNKSFKRQEVFHTALSFTLNTIFEEGFYNLCRCHTPVCLPAYTGVWEHVL